MIWKGAASKRYSSAIRFGRRRGNVPQGNPSLLSGEQRSGWPLMAATVRQDLGSVRHVLAQMTVAGTHMTPFGFMGTGRFSPDALGTDSSWNTAQRRDEQGGQPRSIREQETDDLENDPMMLIVERGQ